jgi:hypothetical protein
MLLVQGCGGGRVYLSETEGDDDDDDNTSPSPTATSEPTPSATPTAEPTPTATASPSPTPTTPACTEDDWIRADRNPSHHKYCTVEQKRNWLCHIPEGNTSNGQWLCLKDKATCSHLANHSWDYLRDNNSSLDCDKDDDSDDDSDKSWRDD